MKKTTLLIVSILLSTLTSFSQKSMCDSLINFIIRDRNYKAEQLINQSRMDVNCLSEYGSSPLGLACGRGNFKLVSFLLKNGASPNMEQENKRTPLFDASAIYDQLLEPNLSPKSSTQKYDYKIKDKIVKLLITKGADVHIVDKDKTTLLMQAIMSKRETIAILYMGLGINVNSQNSYGNTALMYAVLAKNAKIIKHLLQCGADSQLKNLKAKTALDMAKELSFAEGINLLSNNSK